MKRQRNPGTIRQRGFTLVEMLLTMAILGLIVGAVLSQMGQAQQRMSTENAQVDDFQQSRDFVEQFFRDINQIGDPNIRMFDVTVPGFNPANPASNDSRFAVGLVKIADNGVWFEGSTNGAGTVQVIQYQVNSCGSLGSCLQRSQVNKQNGDPLTGQPAANWGTEINDVVNSTVFEYYTFAGTRITGLPLDISTAGGANTLASIKTIQIRLQVQDLTVVDPQTGLPIEANFEGKVSLNNCSMVANGQPMSCQ